ncbi:MAG: molybdopterin/thiamine biosynthesis adenylyltransferase [Halieaceae bacterium]
MNDEQLLRYSRQILLPGWDIAGQQKILEATVLIVGLGGLGCPVALYLAAAGVGRLILADDDLVELSNLQRQIAHQTSRIGDAKVESARDAVLALNPEIQVEVIARRLEGTQLQAAVAEVDLVVDATDNFNTRFALNRAARQAGIPLVSGAAIRSEGQIAVFDPRQENTACYECLYEDKGDEDLSCSESGVLAPLVGVIGSLQALEALKVLAGYGKPLVSRLFVLDGFTLETRCLEIPKRPGCPVCSVF